MDITEHYHVEGLRDHSEKALPIQTVFRETKQKKSAGD